MRRFTLLIALVIASPAVADVLLVVEREAAPVTVWLADDGRFLGRRNGALLAAEGELWEVDGPTAYRRARLLRRHGTGRLGLAKEMLFQPTSADEKVEIAWELTVVGRYLFYRGTRELVAYHEEGGVTFGHDWAVCVDLDTGDACRLLTAREEARLAKQGLPAVQVEGEHVDEAFVSRAWPRFERERLVLFAELADERPRWPREYAAKDVTPVTAPFLPELLVPVQALPAAATSYLATLPGPERLLGWTRVPPRLVPAVRALHSKQ
jgi:hypothetical protein